jgi:TonB family protein
MMMKRQTSPWARMKALFVLPVAFVAVTVISCTSPKEKKTDANQEVVQQSQPASAPEIQVVTYAPQPKEVEQGEVFQVVEEQPMFPGGMEEMMKFLQQNVKYPKEAQEQGKQGRVIVQFVVNKDGSISNDTIVRSVDPLLDAEALRVVRSMPNWTPGKQKGEPVRVRFTLPVTFRLDNGKESTQKAETTNSEEVFKVTEELPQYPGGNAELMKYLAKNIRYPKGAQEQGIQGRVIVQFTVQKDGSITDSKVVKPAHTLLDAEALRVVDAMPKWIPAKQRGKEVACYFTIPVMFRLQ